MKNVIASYSENEVNNVSLELSKEYGEDNVLGIPCDVKNLEDVKKVVKSTVDKFGKVDILVNNAGITSAKPTLSVTDEEFINMFDVNTFGPFRFIREVIPYMQESGGSIINTSSMVGTYGGRNQSAYASSKFAINGLTKSLAKELGIYNIRVNAVAPGVVETDMMSIVSDEMKTD